jgi:hypothetical protein
LPQYFSKTLVYILVFFKNGLPMEKKAIFKKAFFAEGPLPTKGVAQKMLGISRLAEGPLPA